MENIIYDRLVAPVVSEACDLQQCNRCQVSTLGNVILNIDEVLVSTETHQQEEHM